MNNITKMKQYDTMYKVISIGCMAAAVFVLVFSLIFAYFLIILSCVLLVVEPSLELPSTPTRPRLLVTLPSSSRRWTGDTAVADQGVPGVPAHLEAAHLSARYVTLAWDAPDEPGLSPVIGYTIYWKEFSSYRFGSFAFYAQMYMLQ